MGQNKTILIKIKDHTKDEPEIQNFLAQIFQFESSPKNGWYENRYNEILESTCKEDEEK